MPSVITPKKMTLSQTQSEFAQDVAELIQYIHTSGYSCTFGDAYRDPRSHGEIGSKTAYGAADSLHKQRLAIDLNLFKDGLYLSHTEAHRLFGDHWKGLHPDNVWGGDFTRKDGNHYERKP